MKCCIFGAGDYHGEGRSFLEGAFIIAADGGLCHLVSHGVKADRIIGDFDSLGKTPVGDNVTVYPVMKDDTDMALAVGEGLAHGCDDFYLFGGMGGRIDHTFANLSLLLSLAKKKIPAYLVGEREVVTVLSPGEKLVFSRECEGILSVFSASEAAEGVTLSGLLYPLQEGVLTHDRALGVSNHFVGEEASVRVKKGLLTVVWERGENPFPCRTKT